ncbi:hypothetical protein F4775DRAFT_590968 [Biscogniauxia sp. FL1348]|nr:hypothetical protein F4775DRAFT_590968 [Biscogniauxia sp. FL1348]
MCGAQLYCFQCGHYEIQSFAVCASAPNCSMQLSWGYSRVSNSHYPPTVPGDASLFGVAAQTAREFLRPSGDGLSGTIYVARKELKCSRCSGQSPQTQSSAMSTGPCLAVKHYYQCGCQPRGDPRFPFQFLCSCKGDFHGFAQGLLLPLSGRCDRLLCPDCGDGSYCNSEEGVLPQAEIAPLLFQRDSKGISYAPYGQHGKIDKDSRKDFDSIIHVV